MNVKYINPLLESTINVLSTMAFIEVSAGKPSVRCTAETSSDITGVISLNGDGVEGWLAVGFNRPTIFSIVQNMLGEEVNEIDDTVVDLVGEITNMITGSAKRMYSELGLEIGLDRPSVFVGEGKTLYCESNGESVVLPFESGAGPLQVEFYFH